MVNGKSVYHKVHQRKLTAGQRAADFITKWVGSWYFIAGTLSIIVIWAALNTYLLLTKPWDPYPFILLNLALSCLAALHAPIILMTQNRQSEKDRQRLEYDYLITRKSEKEIKLIQLELIDLKEKLLKKSVRIKSKDLEKELKEIESELKILESEMKK